MRAYREKPYRPAAGGAGDSHLRKEIEADVLELWLGVSRLMSRLREPVPPRKTGHRQVRPRVLRTRRPTP